MLVILGFCKRLRFGVFGIKDKGFYRYFKVLYCLKVFFV